MLALFILSAFLVLAVVAASSSIARSLRQRGYGAYCGLRDGHVPWYFTVLSHTRATHVTLQLQPVMHSDVLPHLNCSTQILQTRKATKTAVNHFALFCFWLVVPLCPPCACGVVWLVGKTITKSAGGKLAAGLR